MQSEWVLKGTRDEFTRIQVARRMVDVSRPEEIVMLHYAIVFLVIALIAAVLGFGGIAGGAFGIAKFLFWAAIIIAVVLFLLGVTIFKKVT